MEYKSTIQKVCESLQTRGINLLDPESYFSFYIVKRNYGISSITSANDQITFHVIDERKFMMKVLKYGF